MIARLASYVSQMSDLIAVILEKLTADLEDTTRRALSAAEQSTHEESRPEDPKDTRGLETSYLARGLGEKAAALDREIKLLEFLPRMVFAEDSPVSAGALATIEDEEGEIFYYLVLPCAGGVQITVNRGTVRVVTPTSPIGAALLGKRCGDDVEVKTKGRNREFSLIAVEEAW